MSSLSGHEIEIVRALSAAEVPEELIKQSDIKSLIDSLVSSQDEMSTTSTRLNSLRDRQKNSNFLSNWWNDTDDDVQDAALDLSIKLSSLNRHSSQLLIVNTAISKVLADQQGILLIQQKLLEAQAAQLEDQNTSILDHQLDLKNQQNALLETNRELRETQIAAQAQAEQFMACLLKVRLIEQSMEAAAQSVRADMIAGLEALNAQFAERLSTGFAEQSMAQDTLKRNLTLYATRNRDATLAVVEERCGALEGTLSRTEEQHRQGAMLHQQAQASLAEQLRLIKTEIELIAQSTKVRGRILVGLSIMVVFTALIPLALRFF